MSTCRGGGKSIRSPSPPPHRKSKHKFHVWAFFLLMGAFFYVEGGLLFSPYVGPFLYVGGALFHHCGGLIWACTLYTFLMAPMSSDLTVSNCHGSISYHTISLLQFIYTRCEQRCDSGHSQQTCR